MKPLQLPPAPDARNFDSLDPLDVRYWDPDIATYLSERGRIAHQAYVEAALAHALADTGVCNRASANAIEKAAADVTAQEVYDEEKHTRHDIRALVNCIKRRAPESAAPFVHFGATSYDIIATACALQMRSAMTKVVIPRLQTLMDTLIRLSETYAHTVQIGRTHGQHALPVTFGFAISEYVSRLGESIMALERLAQDLRGKFSGAVGAYNALTVFVDDPVAFEKNIMDRLGLHPAPYSTQIVPPEGMIRLQDELAITAGIMANLAHDMRHLQRSEIAEVRERFEPGQTGSSTMAHKRNPWNFENVISMSKQVTAQTINANLNIASEHQRDLTDSASSRFYVIAPACVASMAQRLNTVMGKLEVDADAMQRNLRASRGAIAAEPFYLLLAKHGHPSAHETSKALAHQAMQHSETLTGVIQKDPEAAAYWRRLSKAEKAIITDPEAHYTGLAAQKAKTIAKHWKKQLDPDKNHKK